jgi:hypothetical protein
MATAKEAAAAQEAVLIKEKPKTRKETILVIKELHLKSRGGKVVPPKK